jgi:hypothetical protein
VDRPFLLILGFVRAPAVEGRRQHLRLAPELKRWPPPPTPLRGVGPQSDSPERARVSTGWEVFMRRYGFVVFMIGLSLAVVSPGAAAPGKKGRKFGTATAFGPVALGATQGLRLCHANTLGDKTQDVEWVFFAVPAPVPIVQPPATDGLPVAAAGRLAFTLPPGTGNCADFVPADAQVPEGSSIIAVLIGLKPGLGIGASAMNDIASSAQLTDLTGGTPVPIGALLPAVQKANVVLPAVQ